MLVDAANKLNLDVSILDKENNPATLISSHARHYIGDFQNPEDIIAFAKNIDVLTVEIEHINVEALRKVQEVYPNVDIHPSPETLAIIQDKYLQKVFLRDNKIPVSDFRDVDNSDPVGSIREISKDFGFPMMLKSKRLAYDGRGNHVITNESEIQEAVTKLSKLGELYVEKWVNFKKELALVINVLLS